MKNPISDTIKENQVTEACDVLFVDHAKMAIVRRQMPRTKKLLRLAKNFGAMAALSRVKILYALSVEELCVCEITSLLGITQSGVSHQLKVLRELGLVKYRKEGKMVYYSLNDEHIKVLFEQGLSHAQCEGHL